MHITKGFKADSVVISLLPINHIQTASTQRERVTCQLNESKSSQPDGLIDCAWCNGGRNLLLNASLHKITGTTHTKAAQLVCTQTKDLPDGMKPKEGPNYVK